MNEAIKLAIEKGGYESWWTDKPYEVYGNYLTVTVPSELPPTTDILFAELTQEPRFWQALGKALGWNHDYVCEHCGNDECESHNGTWYSKWQYHAHKYFDLVLTGGDTEKFWEKLITQNAPTKESRA